MYRNQGSNSQPTTPNPYTFSIGDTVYNVKTIDESPFNKVRSELQGGECDALPVTQAPANLIPIKAWDQCVRGTSGIDPGGIKFFSEHNAEFSRVNTMPENKDAERCVTRMLEIANSAYCRKEGTNILLLLGAIMLFLAVYVGLMVFCISRKKGNQEQSTADFDTQSETSSLVRGTINPSPWLHI